MVGHIKPKTGIEPMFKSYKEFVLLTKLFRHPLSLYLGKESNLRLYIFRIVLLPISYQSLILKNNIPFMVYYKLIYITEHKLSSYIICEG